MKVKYISAFLIMLAALSMNGGCSANDKDFQLSAQQAAEYAVEGGQIFLDDSFTEWKTWTQRPAVSQTVNLQLLLDNAYEKKFNIWLITLEQENEARTVNFVIDDETGAVLGGWDSYYIDISGESDDTSGCTFSEAIVNAILYYSIRSELTGHLYPYRRIYLTADDLPVRDNVLLEDINFCRNTDEKLLPNGQAVWRVTFCEHTEPHNVFEFDIQVVVGRDDGVVYGFYSLGP